MYFWDSYNNNTCGKYIEFRTSLGFVEIYSVSTNMKKYCGKKCLAFTFLVVFLLVWGHIFSYDDNAKTIISNVKLIPPLTKLDVDMPRVQSMRYELGKRNETVTRSDPRKRIQTEFEPGVQIENGILRMIQQIGDSDTTPWGEANMEPTANYTCVGNSPPKNGVEDLLCMTQPSFLPASKNPCWYNNKNALRCLPYFQVIGMDKSGTTDLFDRIAKHPDVRTNKGTMSKETMWWSWKRYGHWLKRSHRIETFERYLDYFVKEARSVMSKMAHGYITGDGTPTDLWDMSGWVSIPQNGGLEEPKFITPHLMKHINPAVKLLVILRDPVERVYSDYFFLGLGKMTPAAFHKEVMNSIKLLHTCTRAASLRACLYSRNLHLNITARLHLGFYPLFIKDWLKVFPREQILIFRTEDYSDHIGEHVKAAFTFLELRELPEPTMNNIASSLKKHVTKRKKNAGEMMEQTRAILQRLYQASKSELAEILHDDKYLWKQS